MLMRCTQPWNFAEVLIVSECFNCCWSQRESLSFSKAFVLYNVCKTSKYAIYTELIREHDFVLKIKSKISLVADFLDGIFANL